MSRKEYILQQIALLERQMKMATKQGNAKLVVELGLKRQDLENELRRLK